MVKKSSQERIIGERAESNESFGRPNDASPDTLLLNLTIEGK